MDMPFRQLAECKQQLDQVCTLSDPNQKHLQHVFVLQEIEVLSRSVQQLTNARQKFQESSDCIERQSTVENNATILVPLTGSMYVPGSVVDKNKFMIDIGTGYFVEKDTTAALEFFTRKIAFLNSRIEEYVRNVQERSFVRESEFIGVSYRRS